jgi:hypothetical protein
MPESTHPSCAASSGALIAADQALEHRLNFRLCEVGKPVPKLAQHNETSSILSPRATSKVSVEDADTTGMEVLRVETINELKVISDVQKKFEKYRDRGKFEEKGPKKKKTEQVKQPFVFDCFLPFNPDAGMDYGEVCEKSLDARACRFYEGRVFSSSSSNESYNESSIKKDKCLLASIEQQERCAQWTDLLLPKLESLCPKRGFALSKATKTIQRAYRRKSSAMISFSGVGQSVNGAVIGVEESGVALAEVKEKMQQKAEPVVEVESAPIEKTKKAPESEKKSQHPSPVQATSPDTGLISVIASDNGSVVVLL